MYVGIQFPGIGGNGVSLSVSRNSLNSFRAAAGGLANAVSFLALRIHWRSDCTLMSGQYLSSVPSSWSLPRIRRSRQASIR